MGRLRWAEEGCGRWELDMEAPVTMEGTARAVPGDPLPLGLSRGRRITRPKQLDFMHRFMSSPLVPSFAGDPANGGQGLLLHHAHTVHLTENWSTTIMDQLDVQKISLLFKEFASNHGKEISWPKIIFKHLLDIFSWGLGTEFLFTQNSSFLVEMYNVKKGNRGKAIFQQKHNSGKPKHFGGDQTTQVPPSLLPGLCARAAASIKENWSIWRKKEGKLRMVQPYDVFLSDPHITASGVLGAVASASLGDCSARLPIEDGLERCKAFRLYARKNNLAVFADLFASVSWTAQHGNFQRLFLDLTRFNARLDFPSGSAFLTGVAHLSQDLYNSRQLNLEAIRAVCPELTVSLQQQIAGPFSFRVDSRILFDPKDRYHIARLDESIFAIDWALKVLGSAKATAWYSPKHREAMVELRFFES
ncbi:protein TRIGALACTOSYLDIACYLGLYCEROL 4, chloroplastic isoform X2 [Musa acuminata AAA Group]|uniref:protein TRIGALACTOSYLDIACYLGLYCEROL 4, chloroplastic isoform X2 n=1 Tax=Musa acuminata AAA Group TaxID=214697 RepID=UPI0031DF1930